jgi:hypothetical protein
MGGAAVAVTGNGGDGGRERDSEWLGTKHGGGECDAHLGLGRLHARPITIGRYGLGGAREKLEVGPRAMWVHAPRLQMTHSGRIILLVSVKNIIF